MRGIGRLLIGAALALCLFASVGAGSAAADLGLESFEVGYDQSSGGFTRQAGSHGDLRVGFEFKTRTPFGSTVVSPDGNVKDVTVDLPQGFIGNPTAAETCTQTGLASGEAGGARARCPLGSQVGFVRIVTSDGLGPQLVPLWNVQPPRNLPALFGFNFQGVVTWIEPRLEASRGYAISTLTPAISQGLGVISAEATIWGVPNDPSHNERRYDQKFTEENGGFGVGFTSVPAPGPPVPFFTAPTSCDGAPGVFSFLANSWQNPAAYLSASRSADSEETPFVTEGCGRLPFEPTATAQPLSHAAGGPTGLEFGLDVPQNETPYGLASANVRKVVVALPTGMTVSPSAANGLDACTSAQIGLGSDSEPSCPAGATIGTVSVDTPLLADPLEGEVVLAKQGDNPFGSLLAVYLVIRGPGILIKLPGRIDADPTSGRLTTTFDDNPQLPFSHLDVSFRGGPQAPLVAPGLCGTYSTHVEVTSWATPKPVAFDTPMQIDQGCDGPRFAPQLVAGSVDPVAGSSTPFELAVSRGDGQPNLSSLDLTLPKGELANLSGIPYCADSSLAAASAAGGLVERLAPSCPAASRIGTSTVDVGPGTTPQRVTGQVYLAGPYRGAPLSVAVVTPAVAGPFDLGTVVVRAALRVDPETTQVTAVSDPLPQILQGIPLGYRNIDVDLDRPGFSRNPTSCEPTSVDGTIGSATGASAAVSDRFALADCARLAFAPKLSLALKGATRRTAYPALTAKLRTQPGEANLSRVVVTLPRSEFLAQNHIKTSCTRVQFAASACPKGSIYGFAEARTPLLSAPLKGPVYLRSNGGERKLPDLVASLHGQIDINLVGFIDSKNGGIRARFASVPDAPVSSFVLRMKGGKKGLLQNSTNICRKSGRAQVKLVGQNGKASNLKVPLSKRCK